MVSKIDDPLFRSRALEYYLRAEEGGQPLRVSPPWTWAIWSILIGAIGTFLMVAGRYHISVSEQVEGKLCPAQRPYLLRAESKGNIMSSTLDLGRLVRDGEVLAILSGPMKEKGQAQSFVSTPVSGILESCFVEAGTSVDLGDPIAIIRPKEQPLQVEAFMQDLPTVSPGDRVAVGVRLDPSSAGVFQSARVKRVDPMPMTHGTRSSRIVAEVDVRPSDGWEEAACRPGAALEIQFTTRRSLIELITGHQRKR